MLFLANLYPPRPVTRDSPKERYTSRTPRFLVGLVQKTRTKAPCTNSLNCSRGFCPGGFVRGAFCPFSLLSEYICYNRKVNITLNFMFHMYDKTCSCTPPLPKTITPSLTPPPSNVTFLMDVPSVAVNPTTIFS